jgi:hypothetical protein
LDKQAVDQAARRHITEVLRAQELRQEIARLRVAVEALSAVVETYGQRVNQRAQASGGAD